MLTMLRVGPLELAVLTALWDSGRPLTIREVRDQLSYPRWLSYTTAAEALNGLFFRGRVRRTRRHGRWYYSPTQSRSEYLAGCIRVFLTVAGDPATVLALAAQPPGRTCHADGPDEPAAGACYTSSAAVQGGGRESAEGSS